MEAASYEATTTDRAPKSTSNLVEAFTTIDSANFALELARGCVAVACRARAVQMAVQGRRTMAGEVANHSIGWDVVVSAKMEFRRANLWLDRVLGPLSGENVSFLP